jgi:mannuronan synthase
MRLIDDRETLEEAPPATPEMADQLRAEFKEWATLRRQTPISPERRNERQFVRARMPLEVEHRGVTYRGFDISLNGFSLFGTPAIDEGAIDDFIVRLLFRGYAIALHVRARLVRQGPQEGLSGFLIVEIDDDRAEALRKVLRAYLAGQLVTMDGLLASADGQTARPALSLAMEPADHSQPWGGALWPRRAWYSAIIAATCVVFLVLAASLFQQFGIMEATFATVTAPKLDVRSPADGQLDAHRLRPGDRVARDQLLAEVRDGELEAELELERARYATVRRLLEDAAGSASNLDLASLPLPALLPGLERPDALAAAVALEQAQVTALEHRAITNRLYASCDCAVFWVAPAGDWVRKGDLLFTLVRTGPADLMVEALLPVPAVGDLRQHQLAFIELADSQELVEARIALIALDSSRQPRAGFPRWAQQDQTMASVLLSPSRALPSDMIGTPIKVIFPRAPEITMAAASLRLRLGEVMATLGLSGGARARETP